MVDHSAEPDRGFRELRANVGGAGWSLLDLPGALGRYFARRAEMAEMAEMTGIARHQTAEARRAAGHSSSGTEASTGAASAPPGPEDPFMLTPAPHRRPGFLPGRPALMPLAIAASLIWLAAVGAYGAGLYLRLSEGEGGPGLLPTLDVMFFVFAAIGPLAMLWIVVLALRRADGVSDALVAQADSALALATTIANLNDTVEDLGTTTRTRIEDACRRMETQAAQTARSLDEGLTATSKRLDHVLVESAVLIDDRVAERIERYTQALEKRLTEDAGRMVATIEAELEALGAVKSQLTGQIEGALTESRTRMDATLEAQGERMNAELAEARARIAQTLEGMAKRLAEAQSRQAGAVERDLAEPLRDLSTHLAGLSSGLAANPPASAEALAELLGEAARRMVADDRQAIEQALARLDALETRSAEMLAQIDRTSRLNPLMETPGRSAPAQTAAPDVELPFADLPRQPARGALNWTAVVRVLDGVAPNRATRQAIERAAADPDVARLVDLRGRVAAVLAEDRVHLEDLRPDHATAEVWAAFGRGTRGGEVSSLAMTPDEVTAALVRARLRSDADFHALALRLVEAYGALVARAVAEIGPDTRLIEVADTTAGRAMALLGGMLGAFDGAGDFAGDMAAHTAANTATNTAGNRI